MTDYTPKMCDWHRMNYYGDFCGHCERDKKPVRWLNRYFCLDCRSWGLRPICSHCEPKPSPRPKFLSLRGWTIKIPLLNIKLGGRKKPKKEKE